MFCPYDTKKCISIWIYLAGELNIFSCSTVKTTFIGHIFERISIFYHLILKISKLENRILVIYAWWHICNLCLKFFFLNALHATIPFNKKANRFIFSSEEEEINITSFARNVFLIIPGATDCICDYCPPEDQTGFAISSFFGASLLTKSCKWSALIHCQMPYRKPTL